MDDFLALLHESSARALRHRRGALRLAVGPRFPARTTRSSRLLAEQFPDVPRLALTATADHPTRKDIVERLHLAGGRTFIAGFDRPNIHYSIVPKESPQKQLLQFIRQAHPRDSGIVYCLSRKMVDETAAWLGTQGFKALPYHAGMEAEDRARNQERFLREDNMIMVATIAFGMGIDKPDVRFVAHLTVPKNIEAYYQETGRAGRDGLPANALMLYGMQDAAMQRNFIDESSAPESQKIIEHQKLNALLGLCEAASCRRRIMLEYFGDSSEPCGNCDTCHDAAGHLRRHRRRAKGALLLLPHGPAFRRRLHGRCAAGQDATSGLSGSATTRSAPSASGPTSGRSEWQSIFRQLVALHLLTPDGTEYGGLKITPRGLQFLQKKEVLRLRKFTGKAEGGAGRPREIQAARSPSTTNPTSSSSRRSGPRASSWPASKTSRPS